MGGFTCFLCHEPFNATNMIAAERGDGDGHLGRPVSATKCGHLFHSGCLKNRFEAMSSNAWDTKSCPVCTASLGVQDIIRVNASPIDVMASKGPRMEKLVEDKKQLQHENAELHKRLDLLVIQHQGRFVELDELKREKEDLQGRVDAINRLNIMHISEIERYKLENEKLKNIIITLTAKLTGNSSEEFNGVAHGQSQRLTYPDDVQGFAANDFALFPNSNENVQIQKLGRPPGLKYAPAGTPVPWNSDTLNPNPGLPHSSADGNYATNHALPMNGAPELPSLLSMNAMYPIMMERKNGRDREIDGRGNDYRKNKIRDPGTSSWDFVDRDLGMFSVNSSQVNGSAEFAKANQNNPPNVKLLNNSSICSNEPQTTPTQQRMKTADSSPLSKDEDNNNDFIDRENTDPDSSGKWFEKRSKRRAASKGRSRNSSSGATKTEYPKDKQLYGWFTCGTCNAKWGSSHTYVNQPQTCRYCQTQCEPYNQGPILSRRQLGLDEIKESDQEMVAKNMKKKD